MSTHCRTLFMEQSLRILRQDCIGLRSTPDTTALEVCSGMQTEEITIRVDREAAQAYRRASEQERAARPTAELRLRDAVHPSGSLQELMRDLREKRANNAG